MTTPPEKPRPALDAETLGTNPEPEPLVPLDTLEQPDTPPAAESEPDPVRRRTRSRATSSAAKRKPGSTPNTSARAASRRSAVERGVSNTINALAFTVTMLDEFDGACIARGEADLTGAVMATADANPRFMAWLERSIKGGSYLQLVAATGAIAVPILAHHRLLPPSLAFAMPNVGPAPDYPPPSSPAPEPAEPFRGDAG